MEIAIRFREQYSLKHRRCPKCRSEKIARTLFCPVLDTSRLDEYRDGNRANCSDCGWKGVVDNLVP